MKKRLLVSFVLIASLMISSTVTFAIDGVWHRPLGTENFYPTNELPVEPCERYPRDPIAGENVYIKLKTWPVESGQATWITWSKNGVSQPDIGGQWKYNGDGGSYWEANMGSFQKGDAITYTVHANQNGANEKTIGPFSFTVTAWDWVTSVSSYNNYNNRLELTCNANSGDFNPKINIAFPETDYFRLQFAPDGTGAAATGASNYTVSDQGTYLWVSTNDMKLKIIKNPYQLEVYKSDGTTLVMKEYDRSSSRALAFLTDGSSIVSQVEENFYTPSSEKFFGFGQRYNDLNKRGMNVDIYTINWYKGQDDKAYLPIPFYVNSNKYGFYLDSTYYSQFRIGTDTADKITIRANAGRTTNKNLDFYIFTGGDYKNILGDYSSVVGKPKLPPTWAFGPWISANEWDTQAEVQAELDATKTHNIPTSAMVLEQWSDEETFYIFNDAAYTPNNGSSGLTESDFTFGGKWPNPKQLISNAHTDKVKVLLWQIPVLRYNATTHAQRSNDESYAIANNYIVKNSDGTPYRFEAGWFGNSLSPDFTNTAATNWWFAKRQYLMDDLNIDGFKCDGGEFIWGRDTTFSDGSKGDEMRNAYPDLYIQAYYDYTKGKKTDSIIFSRSGGAKASAHPLTWAGDQASTWAEYQACVRAGISASLSGVPFVTWDLAGFSGEIPATDLYKRSVAQAAFSPIMQLHSESGNPSVSHARTPWNMASRTGDNDCLTIYRKFANVRMSLMPYLYNEAKYTSDTAIPMMRHMAIDFPTDSTAADQTFQYMLGGSLLVAPLVEDDQFNKNLYLPSGEWVDFWWGAQKPGGNSINYYAGLDAIPVFVKAGSIIPMNLNDSYDLGGTIGNDVDNYNNLTFRIYPRGISNYSWYDYVSSTSRSFVVTENDSADTVTVSVPAIPRTSTLQVFSSKPTGVTVDGNSLTEYSTKAAFISAQTGWYYDINELLTYVKVGSSSASRSIVLNGVYKASYEAEYATQNNVATNNNHTGYYGSNFVDQFETAGDYVEFDVWAETAGTKTIDIRYSAGSYNAQRSVYLNGSHSSDVALAKTNDWDTWGSATLQLNLVQGKNTIKISYDSGDYTGINLDNITIR